MILPMVVRYAERCRRDVDRYALWVAALDQLRNDWDQNNDLKEAQFREYLQGISNEYATDALQDLIAEHLRLSWQAGRGTRLEMYLEIFGHDFPKLASADVIPADLVEDEFLARYVLPNGDAPSLDEYIHRFPARTDVMKRLHARCLADGRYVKLRKRGQGAMGQVWEAFDRDLRRIVAVKEPRPDLANNPDALERFAEEARITASLDHPGIVSLHDHGPGHPDTPFYVMRLVNGLTLGEHIRNYYQPTTDRSPDEKRLHWHQLLGALLMVCDAVAHAHSRQVLHRDLKPGNVLMGDFGEIVILDWGMAKRMGPADRDPLVTKGNGSQAASTHHQAANSDAANQSICMVVGTPQYMAPEQADGIADERSDVFGLGTILYEMLTGRPPHEWPQNSLPLDWKQGVRDANVTPPRRVNPRSPRILEAICLKALAPDPAIRYQTATELAGGVRRYLAGLPVKIHPTPSWLTYRRSLRRRLTFLMNATSQENETFGTAQDQNRFSGASPLNRNHQANEDKGQWNRGQT